MFHHGYSGSLLVKQWQQATQAWQRVGQFCYRCVISSPWKMNTFGKLLVKTMSTVFQQVNLFFNGNRQLIRAYGFHTCLICGRHVCFWYLYRDRRNWGIRVKQCDISWSGPHWTKINPLQCWSANIWILLWELEQTYPSSMKWALCRCWGWVMIKIVNSSHGEQAAL